MRCARCDLTGPIELTTPREATVGTVGALLERLPVVRCRAGHGAPAPIGDVVATVCLEVLPAARRRRLRGLACGSCKAPLTMPVRRTRRPVTVADLVEVPVLTVHLDLPVTRCPACATDQVPPRSGDDVGAAVRALFAD